MRTFFTKQFSKTIPSVEKNAPRGKIVISSSFKNYFYVESFKINHNIAYFYGVNATLFNFLRTFFTYQFSKTILSVEINAKFWYPLICKNYFLKWYKINYHTYMELMQNFLISCAHFSQSNFQKPSFQLK